VGPKPILPERLAQLVELLVERMASALGVALGPQERGQTFARDFALEGEVDQQREPQPLRRQLVQLVVALPTPDGTEGEQANLQGDRLCTGGSGSS
jgi:hypothetical protein